MTLFKRGTLYYQRQFHNDLGTAENPTAPAAELQKPDGSWASLTAPAIQNSKVGLFGGSLDMSNATTYPVGRYSLRVSGTVTTAKVVGTVFEFTLAEAGIDDIAALVATAVWNAGTKALTDKAEFSGIATNMVAEAPVPADNAAAVRVELADELALLDEAVSAAKTLTGDYDAAMSAAQAGDAMTLDAAYDAAKVAASQDSVDDIAAKTTNLPEDPADASDVALDVGAIETKVDAIKAKTDTIGALEVTVRSPMAEGGLLTIYAGDDYSSEDGREIAFLIPTDSVPDLSGAMLRLRLQRTSWEASSCSVVGDDWRVVFEPTAAQTKALVPAGSTYKAVRSIYELEVVLEAGHTLTLLRGVVATLADVPTSP